MRIYIVMLLILLQFSCQKNEDNASQESKSHSFFVGTYTKGESEGIYKYLLQDDGTLKSIGLVAKSENPSFLTKSEDGKYLVVVNETNKENTGTVESFLITEDSLELISRSSSGGAHPCYVAVNNNGVVLTANYTGGSMGLLRLNKKGELTTLLDKHLHTGSGITDRQKAPHVHSAWFEPASNQIISVDLGTDELWFSQLDTSQQKLLSSEQEKLKMPPGSGPRHLVFHPNNQWIYVLNELSNAVVLVQKSDDGKYENGVSITTLPADFTEPNTSADIHISSDGKFVYTSNRGHNSIAIYSVNTSDGSLALVGHESTKGDGPRNFSLSPGDEYLLVANQHSNNIVSFKRDKATGLLMYESQVEAPTPVCILF